jgi:hypothetical protein
MFDHKINQMAVNLLILAPSLYCIIGYWMLSNIQIFWNETYFFKNYNESMLTGHDLSSPLRYGMNHSMPLLILLSLFVFPMLFNAQWRKGIINYMRINVLSSHSQEVDQSLFHCMN